MMRWVLGKYWLCFAAVFLLIGCQTAPSATPMPTLPSLATAVPQITIAHSPTPLSNPISISGATAVPIPATATPMPQPAITNNPTSTPFTIEPDSTNHDSQLTIDSSPTPSATPKQYATIDATAHPPGTAVPTPIPAFTKPDHITNIILLGNDVETPQGGRTDSLILVSIDRDAHTATMLSLPRDLFVVIPGWQMTRINLALPHGHGTNYPGGGGGLIKDTIEYNLGIPVDYYARIGFNGFKEAVDAVGGIEMVINCPLTDWRLITPDLDPELEESWEQFTLEPGVHEMDGDLALWFARSRRTTNDFERGLRQQRVLQAILQQGLRLDVLGDLPDLWQAYQHNIETDMSLPLLLELAAMAPDIQANGISHLTLPAEALRAWQDTGGSSVQLLQWETAVPTLNRLMQPAALNRATGPTLTIAVVTNDYILYRQMADNLAWYGFVPQYEETTTVPARTEIEYYGRNRKGSYDWLLSWLFHRQPTDISDTPDETSLVDYRVWLGADANPCLSYLEGASEP